MNRHKIILTVVLALLFSISNAQETKLTFTEMLSFTSTQDFPNDVFSLLEKKGFTFVKKTNYNELFDSSHIIDIDLSKCNRYYYANQNTTVIISFCENLARDSMFECTRMITLGSNTAELYDYLVAKIKVNCMYSKARDGKFNGIPVKTYCYKHKSGATFEFRKYFGDENKIEYYVTIQI